MTGSELAAALLERLREALPQAEVRAAYDGDFSRRPARPIVCVGLLSEAVTGGAGSAKLGVWLYTAAGDSAAPLFAAVCAALSALPCTVRSVARGGESLWDYAYFSGVPIDALVKANRHIACIGALQEGEEVHIP